VDRMQTYRLLRQMMRIITNVNCSLWEVTERLMVISYRRFG